jgi:uncharacterized protein
MSISMRHGAQRLLLQMLRGYKWLLSPLLPPSCRYVPTCSEYAMEAVARYGAIRGIVMAGWRVLRCHPLAASGYDPVVSTGGGGALDTTGMHSNEDCFESHRAKVLTPMQTDALR